MSPTTCTSLVITSTPSLTTPSTPQTTESAFTIRIVPQTIETSYSTPPTSPNYTPAQLLAKLVPQLKMPDYLDLPPTPSPTPSLDSHLLTPSTSECPSPAPISPVCSSSPYSNAPSPVSDFYADNSLSTYRESAGPKIRVQKQPVSRNSSSTSRRFTPYTSSRPNVSSSTSVSDTENDQSETTSFAQPKAGYTKEFSKTKK